MHVFGHVAVAQLVAWPPGRTFDPTLTAAVICGALLPDIIDKSLRIAGVYPWGRTVGHSVFFWLIVVLLAALWSQRHRATVLRGLALGGISHLLADVADDLVGGLHYTGYVASAWFTWPYLNPDLFPVQVQPTLVDTPHLGLYTVVEAFVVALAIRASRT